MIDVKQLVEDFQIVNDVEVVYLIKNGSQLYGTNSEDSDTDYIGLFVPSTTTVLLKKDPEHLVVTTGLANSKNSSEDIDIQLWSIYKFLNLVKKGETGALDLLFSLKAKHKDEITIIDKPSFTDILLEYFDKFKSKDLRAFVGYCLGQAKKYNIKGARYSELQTFLTSFKKLHYFTDQTLDTLEVNIKNIIAVGNYKYIKMTYAQGPKRQGNNYIWYLEILGRKHALNITISEFLNRMDRMLSSFGARTLAAADGVDNKALSHATRVILECEELLRTGHITFPLKDREFIKEIKYNKDLVNSRELNLEGLMQFLEHKLDEVNQLLEDSVLPDKVEQDVIDEVLTKVIGIEKRRVVLNKLFVEEITRKDFLEKYKNSCYVSDVQSTYYRCLIHEEGDTYLAKCRLQYTGCGNMYSIIAVQFEDVCSMDVFDLFENTITMAKPCDKDFIVEEVSVAEAMFISKYVYKNKIAEVGEKSEQAPKGVFLGEA